MIMSGLLAACGDTSTSGYNPNQPAFPTIAPNPSAAALPTGTAGPVPNAKVTFPLDEAPHNVVTEWWYYTGHLQTNDGKKYGFEFVVFQNLQGTQLGGYVSHFAITDLNNQTFNYDQKLQVAQQPLPTGGNNGFNLNVQGWKLTGLDGNDHIQAAMSNGKYALDISLKDQKGIALHGGGEFSYGPSGASYYYSRPLMTVSGNLTANGVSSNVTGQAWMDHQWGNFTPLAGGGWEWFSTQLNDNSEMMLYYLRDSSGNLLQAFGSYEPPCSNANPCDPQADKPIKTIDIDAKNLDIESTEKWTSPTTGITYPSGWHVTVKGQEGVPNLDLNYKPLLKNQELDTKQTTGVSYWEGAVSISGTSNNQPIAGEGYVELTGYNK